MKNNGHRFDFLSSRLNFIKITNDDLLNMEILHHLGEFEEHVYGVLLQYHRIKSACPDQKNIKKMMERTDYRGPQLGLDIYFYFLVWAKLKEVNKKLKKIVNHIQLLTSSFSNDFIGEFRKLQKRINHHLARFDKEVRNELVHPSLEPHKTQNITMWGTIYLNPNGDIKTHVGKDLYGWIKYEDFSKINELRVELFDLFVTHFSQKPSTDELLGMRDSIEGNIDVLTDTLKGMLDSRQDKEANKLIWEFTMRDIQLSKEGINIENSVKEKFYSVLLGDQLTDAEK
ncbi:MAG: hypothetical protein ABSF52_06580 [Syntrophobacteraceae bacterium]